MTSFEETLISAALFTPSSVRAPDAWVGHLPFAAWLVRDVAPKILVELGTHSGNSYFSFCQSVAQAGLSTQCYAVDTWQGDEHAGYYDDTVYALVKAHNTENYAGFSHLMRMLFDEAVASFADGSIDVLHIDGLHTYEAVRHDFETWAPKLAPGAVVLFHDTVVQERGFGVWKFWQELQEKYPANLGFLHSNGLGVLQLNNAPGDKKRAWLQADYSGRPLFADYFAALGAHSLKNYAFDALTAQFKNHLNEQEKTRHDLALAVSRLEAMRNSTLWRATRPVRVVLGAPVVRALRTNLRRVMPAALRAKALQVFQRHTSAPVQMPALTPTGWYEKFRRGAKYRQVRWRGAVRFSVLLPITPAKPEWLNQAIASVVDQTYPHWELICVDAGSGAPALREIVEKAAWQDARVKSIVLAQREGVAQAVNAALAQAEGAYVLVLGQDDVLEPHALARLADAAFAEESDVLYGDAVVTGENLDEIRSIEASPAFSYSYYLSHPYFMHPVALRTALARQVGGFDAALENSQDIDLILRVLEVSSKVTHVPDILYRWRRGQVQLQPAKIMRVGCAVRTAHLRRLGFEDARVTEGVSFNTFEVRYCGQVPGRILAVIPTKNRVDLLKLCVESLRATTQGLHLDLLVVDHESDDPETLNYLRALEDTGTARVLRYAGNFNYSAINNAAIRACGAGYDYFLFLNNDIEARRPGWLEAMLDLAAREEIGLVGATLLYPYGLVQHSGVILGLDSMAEHAFRDAPYAPDMPGYGASLHATREYSAVTAACILLPQAAFHAVGGFDEGFAVGFGDIDLCLRIGQAGYKVVNCAQAVLIHHESATRGKSFVGDPHPQDTKLFRQRHRAFLQAGDPCFSPLLATDRPAFEVSPATRFSTVVRYRTASGFLPGKRTANPS